MKWMTNTELEEFRAKGDTVNRRECFKNWNESDLHRYWEKLLPPMNPTEQETIYIIEYELCQREKIKRGEVM